MRSCVSEASWAAIHTGKCNKGVAIQVHWSAARCRAGIVLATAVVFIAGCATNKPQGPVQQSPLQIRSATQSTENEKQPPSVTLKGPRKSRDTEVTLAYEVTGIAPQSDIELWRSPDKGATWELVRRCNSPRGRATVNLRTGTWYFRVAAPHAGLPEPHPGEEPHLTVVVDDVPPQLVIKRIEVQRAGAPDSPLHKSYRVIITYSVSDAHLGEPALVVLSACGSGSPFRESARGLDPAGKVQFEVPEFCSPLRLLFRSTDGFGNVTSIERTVWPEDEVDPPRFTVASPKPGSYLRGGSKIAVTYDLKWANAIEKPVSFSWSGDGKTFQTEATELPASGTVFWTVPTETTGPIRLRLEARGRTGRVLTAECYPLYADSIPPEASIMGPPELPACTGVITLSAHDQGKYASGVARVELYAQGDTDPKPFLLESQEGAPETMTVTFPRPGNYSVWIVAKDRVGNSTPLPPNGDPFVLVVRSSQAGITLLTLKEGGVVRPGSTQLLAWTVRTAHLPFASGRVLLCESGREEVLSEVDPVGGKALVTFPKRPLAGAKLRLELVGVDGSILKAETKGFTTDSAVPLVELDQAKAEGETLLIKFRAQDRGPAGLAGVSIFLSPDGGSTWSQAATVRPGRTEITLEPGPGIWGIFLSAWDQAGNRSALPRDGTAPEATVLVGPLPKDALVLETLTGGERVKAGTAHFLAWRCMLPESVLPPGPARAQVSETQGKSWRTLAEGLPATGRFLVSMPEGPRHFLRFRISLKTNFGKTVKAVSNQDVIVDGEAPHPLIVGPSVCSTNKVRFEVQWLGDDSSSLRDVELFMRSSPLERWKRMPCRVAGDYVVSQLPEGTWEVALVATDEVGNRSPVPTMETKGHRILIDVTPPVLQVKRVPEGPSMFAGTKLVYTCSVQDANPDPLSLSYISVLETSTGTEKKERTGLPLDLPVDFFLPYAEGLLRIEFSVRDLAGNTGRFTDMVVIKLPEPVLQVEFRKKAAFAGGSTVKVRWAASDPGPKPVASIALSIDGGKSWSEIAGDLPPEGSYKVPLPPVDMKQAYLRVSLKNAAGKTALETVGPFTISTTPPEAAVFGKVLKP